MKIKHFKTFVFLAFVFITSFNTLRAQEASIVGTWISEEDSNWKMVFENNTCTWFYQNEITQTYNFSISNSSPQCGEDVYVNNNTEYLKITKTQNTSDEICYEIYGLSEQYLTLRVVNKSGFLIFNRQ